MASSKSVPTAVGGYARISDDQAEGWGVESQAADIRAYCRERGWPEPTIFVDNDITASKSKRRPEFEKLIERIRGGLSLVVAGHLDRMYRSPRELEDLIDLVEKTGLVIHTVHGGRYDLGPSDGRAFARVVCSFAKKESEDKARRVSRRRLSDAQLGRPSPGGRRALGYTADRLHLVPEEAAAIRQAADLVLSGGTLGGAQRLLAQRGLLNPKGGPLDLGTVRRSLASARLAGIRVYKGQRVALGVWPAIVTEEEHERLVALLLDPRRQRPAGSTARSHVLSGFLTCGLCNTKLTVNASASGKAVSRCRACFGVTISEPPLLAFVRESVFVLLVEFDPFAGIEAGDVEDVGPLRAEIASLENRIDRANEAYLAGAFSPGELAIAKDAAKKDLDAAYRRLAEASGRKSLDNVPRNFGELGAMWRSSDLSWKRELLDALVISIEVHPVGRGMQTLDRVWIHWR
jgi:site-specific DNA recombinase